MDLLTLLQMNGIEYRQNQQDSAEINLCCPFCVERGMSEDTRFRLGVNVSTGYAHCFHCEFKTRRFFAILGRRLDATIDYQHGIAGKTKGKPHPRGLPQESELLYKYRKDYKDAYKYLRNRGVTAKQIRDYKFHYAFSGRYRGRVVIPVYHGKLLYCFIARDVTGNSETRYLNEGPRGVFNLDVLRKHDIVYVAEGVFKALAIEFATGHPCIATLGSKVSPEQIECIQEAVGDRRPNLFMVPDPDAAGLRGLASFGAALKKFAKVYIPANLPRRQADEYATEVLVDSVLSVWQTFGQLTPENLKLEALVRDGEAREWLHEKFA